VMVKGNPPSSSSTSRYYLWCEVNEKQRQVTTGPKAFQSGKP
jgi:hypothetical protein